MPLETVAPESTRGCHARRARARTLTLTVTLTLTNPNPITLARAGRGSPPGARCPTCIGAGLTSKCTTPTCTCTTPKCARLRGGLQAAGAELHARFRLLLCRHTQQSADCNSATRSSRHEELMSPTHSASLVPPQRRRRRRGRRDAHIYVPRVCGLWSQWPHAHRTRSTGPFIG